jgi:outer membrane protein OmpA-like peptidoglycan-associated protein
MVPKGYSELAPVACNDLLEGRNLNRRVEVWVRE